MRALSAWRMSLVPVGIALGVATILSLVIALRDPDVALLVFVTTLVPFIGTQVAITATLTRALGRFAAAMEAHGAGPPDIQADRDGAAALRWPSLGIEVKGEVHRFRVSRFTVTVGERTLRLRLRRARAGALAALHLAGRGPGLPPWDGRLPGAIGPEPFLAVPLTGLLIGAFFAMLLGPWVGLAVGVAVACASGSALLVAHAVHRPAAVALLQGVVDGGLHVGPPMLLWNGHGPEYLVPTSRGPLVVSWVSLWTADRLFVERGGESRRVPRDHAYADGRALAASLR